MTLDDFEKSLVEEKRAKDLAESTELDSRKRRKRNHHHHHHHHRRHRIEDDNEDHPRRRSKQTLRHHDGDTGAGNSLASKASSANEDRGEPIREEAPAAELEQKPSRQDAPKRDAWMEEPSASGIEYRYRSKKDPPTLSRAKSPKADFDLKTHDNELNKHHLQNLADGKEVPHEIVEEPAQHTVDYVFGDAGAQWRLTKLKGVYRRADESGASADEVAAEQYGDLRAFDDAREEEAELEKRATYGEGYVGKEKPSGELFQERKLASGIRERREESVRVERPDQDLPREMETGSTPAASTRVDQSTLNRLKAQMMKAKARGSSDAARLDSEYNEALKAFSSLPEPQTVVLGAMDNRMLASGQRGDVKAVEGRRGRERGLVEENEDMSIEDMVREERRTRDQRGGDGQRFAERIAKDTKFDNGLDYMDENAAKLAKRVQKSEINLKNTAVSEFQKMNRILDNCPLCHHEDTNTPPVAPIVSLATRVYLTLPTEPEISDGGACIIPIQHRGNLLECDDDEWEEIRNFMKSLTRMYHDQGRDVIFYENAATPQRKKHAGMEVVPLPYSLGETAPAFFKEAILTSDEEWTQHRKLIDTLAKAKQGSGKLAFRRTLAKEMPYFHVWFEIDGGLGHIVEDAHRWPRGDLFAREIIGGMLDKGPDVIKRQGRWHRGVDHRVEGFGKRWRKFDWTRILTDS